MSSTRAFFGGVNEAGFVGLERGAALPCPLFGMRQDRVLDQCRSLFFVRTCDPQVEIMDESKGSTVTANSPFYQVRVVEDV